MLVWPSSSFSDISIIYIQFSTCISIFSQFQLVEMQLFHIFFCAYCNFGQKWPFFGPKSAIMDFFWNFFSNSENIKRYGQNETKIRLIPSPNQELWPKRVEFFEMGKFWDQKISFWAKSPEPLDIFKKSHLAQQRIRFRTCGENFSPIRPASPEKSGVIRTKFPKVIVLV